MQTTNLPPGRAFLVRLDSDANPAEGRLDGRVEHVTSGRRARIGSLSELQEFIVQVLGEEGQGLRQDAPEGSASSRPEEEEG